MNGIDGLAAVNRPKERHHEENVVEQVRRRLPVAQHCVNQQREVHESDELEVEKF